MKFLIFIMVATLLQACTSPSKEKSTAADASQIQKVTLPTYDKQTELQVFYSVPQATEGPYPVVLMMPGTGLFDAEMNFGGSGTDKDLIFLSLAEQLNKIGYAVVRFNYRGIKCNLKNQPPCPQCESGEQKIQHFLNSCLDAKIREKVTTHNIQSDLEQIYQWSLQQKQFSRENVIMFGHSEGSIHISRLIEKNKITPKGVVFMGGITESPQSVVRWQTVERIVDGVMSFDKDENKKVTESEIRESLPASYLSVFPVEHLLPPDGYWTQASLSKLLNTQYGVFQKSVMSKPDAEPYISGGVTQASYQWWKMWLADKKTVIESLKNYKGAVIYHNGDFDSQTNALRQVIFFDKARKGSWKFTVHAQRGHTLGPHPLLGPISEDSMILLLQSFQELKN